MNTRRHRGELLLVAVLAAGVGAGAATWAAGAGASPSEAPFLAENQRAMDTMMAGMNVPPSGDVDRDFATMMIPHHQGAIDMAMAELRHGRNEPLRRLAQEIIVTQQQEISAMRLALGQPLPSPVAAPASGKPGPTLAPPREH